MEIQNIVNSNQLHRTEFISHFFRNAGIVACLTTIFKFYFILEEIISCHLSTLLSCILFTIRHLMLCFRVI